MSSSLVLRMAECLSTSTCAYTKAKSRGAVELAVMTMRSCDTRSDRPDGR
ncbi:MAG TPA: hypothetical protein V6C90_08730 [Coleofasciculaceae cyanobacterium]